MNRTVFILNGPNLNLLGRREPHIYGHTTLDQIRQRSERLAEELDLVCDFRQTNHEGVAQANWAHRGIIVEMFDLGPPRTSCLTLGSAFFVAGCSWKPRFTRLSAESKDDKKS